MESKLVEVVTVLPAVEIPGKPGESSYQKRTLVVADGYDQYMVTLFRDCATQNFAKGDIVQMSLNFKVREYEGRYYQDITSSVANILSRKLNY